MITDEVAITRERTDAMPFTTVTPSMLKVTIVRHARSQQHTV